MKLEIGAAGFDQISCGFPRTVHSHSGAEPVDIFLSTSSNIQPHAYVCVGFRDHIVQRMEFDDPTRSNGVTNDKAVRGLKIERVGSTGPGRVAVSDWEGDPQRLVIGSRISSPTVDSSLSHHATRPRPRIIQCVEHAPEEPRQ